MTPNDSQSVTEEDTFGATRINVDALTNDYQKIDENGDLKAKLWESGDEAKLYLRFRDHDDGRRFNEYCVPLGDE